MLDANNSPALHFRKGLMIKRVDQAIDGRATVPLSVLAELLSTTTSAIYQRIRKGTLDIETIRIGGDKSTIRIPADEIYRVLGLRLSSPEILPLPWWVAPRTEDELIAWWHSDLGRFHREALEEWFRVFMTREPEPGEIEDFLRAGFRDRFGGK